jgi:hypothetical protein
MSNEPDRKVVPNLGVKSTTPIETIIEAVKEQGSKSSGPRAKGYGKPSSKDAGPQQYKKAGKKPATQSGPREYRKGG